MNISLVAVCAYVAFCAACFCLSAYSFLLARRQYRGPTGIAGWLYGRLNPFAVWNPMQYTETGARYIRRALFFIVFMSTVLLTCFLVALHRGKLTAEVSYSSRVSAMNHGQ